VSEARSETRREPRGERVSLLGPARALLEHARRGRNREPVLLDQRAHDLGLVERADRARRCVRFEESPLELRPRPRRIDEDRHARRPGFSQALEPLESVDDLVAFSDRHDADGQILERRAPP